LQTILHVFQERFHLLKVELWQRRERLLVDVLIPPLLTLVQQRLKVWRRLGQDHPSGEPEIREQDEE
jgi:hypothetical protein